MNLNEIGCQQNQYNQQNNTEIQGIPATVSDDNVADKVIDISKLENICINKSDIQDCHRLGKSKSNTTIGQQKIL